MTTSIEPVHGHERVICVGNMQMINSHIIHTKSTMHELRRRPVNNWQLASLTTWKS